MIDYSVIILAWNKEYELELVLESLVHQTFDKTRFEIIIVDDGSDKPLDSLLAQYSGKLTIRYFRLPHTGNRAANRNFGAEQGRGDWLIFLDGDMVASRTALEVMDDYVKDDPSRIAIGVRTELFEFDRSTVNPAVIRENFGYIEQLPGFDDERLGAVPFFQVFPDSLEWQWNLFYSHSICVLKKSFRDVGGFDPVFSDHWGAEDIELGYRLSGNGAVMKLLPQARFYHLYHGLEILEKESEVQFNYDIFLRKHYHWTVEIFVRESEVEVDYKSRVFRRIRERKHVIESLANAGELEADIPDNTILFGIEDRRLVVSPKVRQVLSPESGLADKKILNAIGTKTFFGDDSFACALVSKRWESADAGLFHCLMDEASRIAKTVAIVDCVNGETLMTEHKCSGSASGWLKKNRYLFFQLSHYTSDWTSYWFAKLAIAAYRQGIVCGFHTPVYGVRTSREEFSGFFGREDARTLKDIFSCSLQGLFGQIPTIIDPCYIEYNRFPLENRILWTENSSILKDFTEERPARSMYGHRLNSGSESREACPQLPYGVDSAKISAYKNTPKESGRPFRFLWIEEFPDEESGLDLVLECFSALYAGNPDVQFSVLINTGMRPMLSNGFFNGPLTEKINGQIAQEREKSRRFVERTKDAYGQCANILFREGFFTENGITASLAGSDCLVSCSARVMINPFVLESVALGKKPVVVYKNRYEAYFGQNLCMGIEAEEMRVPRPSEGMFAEAGNDCRYEVRQMPCRESLERAMSEAVIRRACLKIDPVLARDFAQRNDWSKRGEDLKKFLSAAFA